jgi:phosphatidylglycerol:prolipoprotein diacylglycerol transferase
MNNIFVSIGSINIYWYSILILIALIVGSLIAIKEAPRRNISLTYISDLIFYLIPVSIIGARIYYVVFNFKLYKNNLLDIFKIWEGGLAIYGAIIASIIFVFYYSKKKEQNFIATLDVMAPSLILGQAIGRWGNFFNQEAYGNVTTLAHLKELHIPKFIINNMYINGNYYTPTFLYESLLCFLGFIILIIARKKNRNKLGMQVAIYFIIYGIARFFIEGLRTDSLYLGNLRISQFVSGILVIIGLLIIINYNYKKNRIKKEKVNVKL